MKLPLFSAVICYFVLSFCCAATIVEKYTSKYDNIDIDAIVASDRLTRSYIDCLLDIGPCTPDGAELKKWLPDSIETECIRCTEVQKMKARKMIDHLLYDKPEWWAELAAMYDPEGIHTIEYKEGWGHI